MLGNTFYLPGPDQVAEKEVGEQKGPLRCDLLDIDTGNEKAKVTGKK